MVVGLAGDVRYALASSEPEDIGDLAHFVPDSKAENRFVRATGQLGSLGAIRYDRPLERDAFRLAPIDGNDKLWVEMRVTESSPRARACRRRRSWGVSCRSRVPRFATGASRDSVREATGTVVSRAGVGARRRRDARFVALDSRACGVLRPFRGLQPGDDRSHHAAGPALGLEIRANGGNSLGRMPKVVFVNEHRIVEVPQGKT